MRRILVLLLVILLFAISCENGNVGADGPPPKSPQQVDDTTNADSI